MINLQRKKDHKWILQKNVSSKDIIKAYVDAINGLETEINYGNVQHTLRSNNIYKGRSINGSLSTMGVRFSQMCFYMFGYKEKNVFIPSPMTSNMLDVSTSISKENNALINLYSMQFPHPYSETSKDFKIYIGRLIVKLLLDERINKKLYIDEMIWFLPFIEKIDKEKYEELVESIVEYRTFSYLQKESLFKSIKNYDDVFSNVTHEINYYFLRIFKGFGVFDIIPDSKHNCGKLFYFHHGNGSTLRNDAYDSRKNISGYVRLSNNVLKAAQQLNIEFSAFDVPTTMGSEDIFTLRDWKIALYQTEPLQYLNCIDTNSNRKKEISNIVNDMIKMSKYGSKDGSDFEKALQPLMELFRETIDVEIIAGSGNTDLLCIMSTQDESIYKMNVDAKTRKTALDQINSSRLHKHLNKHGALFCMVVSPKFASGVADDIVGSKICTIRAEDLGNYCYYECVKSKDGFADFTTLYDHIINNLGTDITEFVRDTTIERYGIHLSF